MTCAPCIIPDFLIPQNLSILPAETVIQLAFEYFKKQGISRHYFFGRSNKREVVESRQMTMYFLRNKPNKVQALPLSYIGNMFKKNHTTVMHSVKQVIGFIEFDENFRNRYADFESSLNQMIKEYSVPQKKPKLSEIIQAACDYLNITKTELRSSSREPELIDKRFIITAFLYNDMDYSVGLLKNALCRNYSNIHNAANRIQERLKHDKVFADRYDRFVKYMQRNTEAITVLFEPENKVAC